MALTKAELGNGSLPLIGIKAWLEVYFLMVVFHYFDPLSSVCKRMQAIRTKSNPWREV